MLDDSLECFNLRIFKNEGLLFEKAIRLVQKDNNFFANIRDSVKLSDSIIIDIQPILGQLKGLKKIQFLIDNITRGKTTVF